MFLKSLQLKLILIFFILISTTVLGIGVYSIKKVEEVYYNGFIEEMLNTISSFGLNIKHIKDEETKRTDESLNVGKDFINKKNQVLINEEKIEEEREEKLTQETIKKIYANFNIYFSLNNISRRGYLLNKDYKELLTNQTVSLTDIAKECIGDAQKDSNHFFVMKDKSANSYIFAYYINYNFEKENIEFTIFVEQDSNYINNELAKIRNAYLSAIIGILIVTIAIVYVTARSITKPISILTSKAESIANGSIEHIALSSKTHAGYEIARLVDTFNLMINQIKGNMNEISSEKNKLETILLHLADGVLAFNLKGNLIHANLAAKKMLNVKDEKTFEAIFSKLKIDINLEKIIYLDDWTSSEQMVNIGDKFFNIFFAPFRDESNRASGVVAVIQDMTEQAKLDDMRKEFVANVSHELKTPLTSIKTYSETMIEQDLDEESKNKFMKVILSEANRMTRLVSDLLQLTKFDYKKVAWNKINFDITELTKQVCEKHKIQAEKKEQILECYITSNVPEVYGDRDGIERVITNIVTNSIKYTPEKGNIKVYVGAVYDDAYIKIIDNGIGIPKEDLRNPDVLIEIIEDLEEQIKRLNKEQQDTIHINVLYRGRHYSVDTQIKWDFKDGDYAYIADDSKDPTKIKIMGHKILNSAGGTDFILTETIILQ